MWINPVVLASVFLCLVSCTKKENEKVEPVSTVANVSPHDSLLATDSMRLSDDSATVKTAVGVQDEEQNALQNEKTAAEKLKEDERKVQ
ncbi:hypothetical protein [Kaistella palustris]|uniref:hypothetical protein n=1 Tax=Kaistella palustris TaxID=493376 RepID=UPI001CA5254D|nr:hypothetical protein [Kaistella palustris]